MTTEPEVIDAEIVPDTPGEPPAPHAETPHAQGHEVVRYSGGSTELVPGATAAERVAAARDIATALNDVIATQGLRTKVGSKKKLDPRTGDAVKDAQGREVWEPKWHVDIEGWQTLATLLGAAIIPRPPVAVIDPGTGKALLRTFEVHEKTYHKKADGGGLKSERTWTVEGHDWQVSVDIVKDGALVASGTGLCSRTEKKWIDSDEFAVQSMAATRAASKAVANCARWIVALAGYSTTPSEEMPAQPAEQPAAEVARIGETEIKQFVDALAHLTRAESPRDKDLIRNLYRTLSGQDQRVPTVDIARVVLAIEGALALVEERAAKPADPEDAGAQLDIDAARAETP